MNRREVFKAFVAGAVSLLGAHGLAEAMRKPRAATLGISHAPFAGDMAGPVMGEQAHWPESALFTDPSPELIQRYRDAIERYRHTQVVAAKIDGEWVGTSDWSPEKVRRLCQPQPLKRRQT